MRFRNEMYCILISFQTSISSDHSHTILTGVLKVLLHSLNCPQSERVLQSMFPTQRSIVAKVSAWTNLVYYIVITLLH